MTTYRVIVDHPDVSGPLAGVYVEAEDRRQAEAIVRRMLREATIRASMDPWQTEQARQRVSAAAAAPQVHR